MIFLIAAPQLSAYETNTVSPGVVQFWSQETLAILEDRLVLGNVVNRDFGPALVNEGDTVKIQRPGNFKAKRIGENDDVTVQNADLTNTDVKLDQVAHVSFRIRDIQQTLNRHDLIRLFLRPAAVELAEQVERILASQVYQFRQNRVPGANNVVGDLGGLSAANVKQQILQLQKQFNDNRAPDDGNRWCFLTTDSNATIQELDLFNAADKVGDMGEALRNGFIGQKLGINFAWGNGIANPTVATTVAVKTDELAANVAVGDTTITVDAGAEFAVGEYITIEGDLQPYRITAIATDVLTISPPARRAILASASDIVKTETGLVDLAGHTGVSDYPVGYAKEIKVDGTGVPVVGQLVSFNTAGSPNVALAGEYGIIDVDLVGGTFITLDRPLETAIANNDVVGYGHAGNYNFGLHPDAFTLAIRGILPPPRGLGAISEVADFNGLAMRTTLSYEGLKRGVLVTMDMLFGVKKLEGNFAVPFLG